MEHAFLAPSSAEIWLNCTPALRRAEKKGLYPNNSTNEFAIEGTEAHEYCQRIIEMDADKVRKGTIDITSIHTKDRQYISSTPRYMQDLCQKYIYACRLLKFDPMTTIQGVETRVDLDWLVPKSFGTVDYFAYRASTGQLFVNDFKFGQYVDVDAKGNKQLQLYALGLIKQFNLSVREVIFSIYQPRTSVSGVKQWIQTITELTQDVTKYRVQADKAYHGYGNTQTGNWCIYCPNKVYCASYKNKINSKVKELPNLSLDEQAHWAYEMKKYYHHILDEVNSHLLGGEPMADFRLDKVVRRYIIVNEDYAREVIKKWDIDLFELPSKAKLEIALSKEDFDGIKWKTEYMSRLVRTKKPKEVDNA